MTDRTTVTMVTFKHPFILTPFDAPQPAGAYRMEVDEERIEGVSFLAYRRTATMLHVPTVVHGQRGHKVYIIDFDELSRALEADALRAD